MSGKENLIQIIQAMSNEELAKCLASPRMACEKLCLYKGDCEDDERYCYDIWIEYLNKEVNNESGS